VNALQNSDQLTLQECLQTMRRLGVAPEDYVVGYEAGFRERTFDQNGRHSYRRGYVQGAEARLRGAHGACDGSAA
jgi:hypothetical protein